MLENSMTIPRPDDEPTELAVDAEIVDGCPHGIVDKFIPDITRDLPDAMILSLVNAAFRESESNATAEIYYQLAQIDEIQAGYVEMKAWADRER